MKKVFTVGLKSAAGLASVSGLALLAGPTLAGIGFAIIAVLVALCWVVADARRTAHLATLIRCVRGTQGLPRQRRPVDSSGPKTAG